MMFFIVSTKWYFIFCNLCILWLINKTKRRLQTKQVWRRNNIEIFFLNLYIHKLLINNKIQFVVISYLFYDIINSHLYWRVWSSERYVWILFSTWLFLLKLINEISFTVNQNLVLNFQILEFIAEDNVWFTYFIFRKIWSITCFFSRIIFYSGFK